MVFASVDTIASCSIRQRRIFLFIPLLKNIIKILAYIRTHFFRRVIYWSILYHLFWCIVSEAGGCYDFVYPKPGLKIICVLSWFSMSRQKKGITKSFQFKLHITFLVYVCKKNACGGDVVTSFMISVRMYRLLLLWFLHKKMTFHKRHNSLYTFFI